MSDEVVVEGISYLPSKRVSEISGYAQDYVGQLCRAGLIDAQRIGGLWYVNLDSLYKHKQKADSYVPVAPRTAVRNDKEALISFDGHDYVSTARASEITGYTKDYVGQLARAGTVFSKQVGNRWYVDRNAIEEHKQEKDKLLAAVQVESVGLPPQDARQSGYPESLEFRAVSRAPELLSYTPERSDLLPIIDRQVSSMHNTASATRSFSTEAAIPIRIHKVPHVEAPTPVHSQHRRRNSRRIHVMVPVGVAATIVLVLTVGIVSQKGKAVFSSNPGEGAGMTAIVYHAESAIDTLGSFLERVLVSHLEYSRPN